MELDAALALVADLTPSGAGATGVQAQAGDVVGVPATGIRAPLPSFAVGVAEHEDDYKLSVRVQDPAFIDSARLQVVVAAANNEVDVEYVGQVSATQLRQRVRPLYPGLSCAHSTITAGTLGAFVTRDGETFALSNNHVLAASNAGSPGDAILQPGPADGGGEADRIGELADFVQVQQGGANEVDCALCRLDEGVDFDPEFPGLGELGGICAPADANLVTKIGRTTGVTSGRVRTFNLNNLVVQFPAGTMRFDRQIEIVGDEDRFSDGGDSGSLVLTAEENPMAVGLLFAGSSGGPGIARPPSFANPISTVLSRLGCQLC